MSVLSAVIGVIGALGGVIVGAGLSARRERRSDERSTRIARHLVEVDLEVKLFALEALANRGRHYTLGHELRPGYVDPVPRAHPGRRTYACDAAGQLEASLDQ